MSKNRPSKDLDEFQDRLFDERPRPTPGFRSEVRSSLFSRSQSRPAQLRTLIFSYAAAGTLLLVVAGLGVAGAGPLSAG